MANLSITTAWNETVEFVNRESRLIFPIAFMLAAFPSAVMDILMPAPPVPGQLPEPGAWALLFPLVLVLSVIGNIAISYLALRPNTSVGEAIGRGARRLLAWCGAFLMLAIAALILFIVLAVIVVLVVPGAMSEAAAGQQGSAMLTATLLIAVLLLPLALYFGARLMLLTPIAAVEEGGPFAIIRRSWSLTAGEIWKLVAFLLLIGIAIGVTTGAIESVAGILFTLVAGPPRPGSTTTLLVALVVAAVQTAIVAYLATLFARIYVQLSGSGRENAFV